MELADSQKEAERLAEVEKKAVYNNAYFEMFGVFPRKFPLDVSFNLLSGFNDFICILAN